MRRGTYITEWLAVAGLAITVAVPLPGLALTGPFHPSWQKHQARAYQAQRPAPGPRQQARPRPAGHAGDWLRRYKDLPPAEQERALRNDPGFNRLPPQRQQMLRDRLQHFSNLPPQ